MTIRSQTKPAAETPIHDVKPALPPVAKQPIHVGFLDGIRGLAALYVVFFHAYCETLGTIPIHRWPLFLRPAILLSAAHVAVAIFIVLSGFCLMLPVARAGRVFPRGIADYLRRRARRILPPYYASTAICVGLWFVGKHLRLGHAAADQAFSAGSLGAGLLSHLLLVQNLNTHWIYMFNAAHWSVATEWQIYFFFPALLLPVLRKLGYASAVAVGYAVGLALIPLGLIYACPWFLGLFAMGMCAADFCYGTQSKLASRPMRWFGLGCACLAAIAALHFVRLPSWASVPVSDAFVGGAACLIIIALVQHAHDGASPALRPLYALFSSPPAAALGAFSYSLYLMHQPFVDGAQAVLRHHGFPIPTQFLILLIVVVPLVLMISYGFHLVFEKPFMNTPRTIALSKPSPAEA